MRRGLTATLFAALVAGAAAAPAGAASTSSDAKVAQAGILVRTDFPTDWKQGKRSDTSDAALDAKAAKIASCKPFMAFTTANRSHPHATSPSFSKGQSGVTNAVAVYPTAAAAAAKMRAYEDPRVPRCLERVYTAAIRAALAKQRSTAHKITNVTADIAPLDGVRIGDEAKVYQGTVDVSLKDGTTQTIGLGVMSVRTGRALDGFSWTSDTDISTALQPAIVASVGRLQQAESAG